MSVELNPVDAVDHDMVPAAPAPWRPLRILFTSAPAYGHVQPMFPLATALRDAGDTVAIAIGPALARRVEAAGLDALHAGDDFSTWWTELNRLHPDQPWNALPPERILHWFTPHLFGEVGARAMLRDLLAVVAEWRPDAIVHETFEFAGPIAAALAGIPSIHHTLSPLPEMEVLRLVADAVAPLWRDHGLAPAPFNGLQRDLCLDICPPSLRTPAAQMPDRVHPLRPVPVRDVGGESLPASVQAMPTQPMVHATLGTSVTNAEQSVLAQIIEALRDEPLNLVVTVGPGNDPAAFGPQPSNVCVERYVPHGLLLPLCSLVVSHGGAGTMLAALSHGIPLLTIPQGADQYLNAQVCADSGAGRTLLTQDLTPDGVRREVTMLLDDGTHRRRAAAVRSEIEAMPSPEQVAQLLHRHVAPD